MEPVLFLLYVNVFFLLSSTKAIYLLTKQRLYRYKKKDNLIYNMNYILNRASIIFKFLSIHIDNSLSWSTSAYEMINKLSKNIFVLRQLRHILNLDHLRNTYFDLIHSHINDGIFYWRNSSHAEKNFRVQRK